MKILCHEVPSPVGRIYIAADDSNVRVVAFDGNWKKLKKTLGEVKREQNEIIEQTHAQLQEYFEGKRTVFDLPIVFAGTEFQEQTWRALLTIPYGETRSYSDQAHLLGRPQAARAIGRIYALNPISIVVPCHRVVGKSGKLAGYAGGLDAKEFLLNLESENAQSQRRELLRHNARR